MKKLVYLLLVLIISASIPASALANYTFITTCNDAGICTTKLQKSTEQATTKVSAVNKKLYNQLRGRIIILSERNNEAYYVDADSLNLYRLRSNTEAFQILTKQGQNISTRNLEKIQAGIIRMHGHDSDIDGLSDKFEDAIGTDIYNFNTDNDTYSDYWEVTNGYNPIGKGKYALNKAYAKQQAGKILIQADNNGEAWYINPSNLKRYYLGSKYEVGDVIGKLGVKILNYNFNRLVK